MREENFEGQGNHVGRQVLLFFLQVIRPEKSLAGKTIHLEPEAQFDSAAVVEVADPSGPIGPSSKIPVL